MSNNALFNLIKDFIINSNTPLPTGFRLSNKISKQNIPYFFFQLPKNNLTIGDFTLTDHHVSVYMSPAPDSYIDHKSQYHYTANIKDKSGQIYCLHVYFNEQDTIPFKPYFSKKVDDGNELIDASEFEEVFKFIAKQHTKSLMSHLRQVQEDTYANYETEYAQLEEDCEQLSKNLTKNKEQYLSNLTEQLLLTEEMLPYTNNPIQLHKRTKFLKSMCNAVEFHNITPVVKPSKKTNSLEPSKMKQMPTQSEKHSKKPTQKQVSVKSFSEALKKINAMHQAYVTKYSLWLNNKCKTKALVTSFDNFAMTLQEHATTLEFGYYKANVNEIQELKGLKNEMESSGISLLKIVLTQEEFQLAQQLKYLFHLLDTSLMHMALIVKKHNLIEFLIKEAIIPVEYQDFTIREIQYHSLIDFCFKNHTPEKSYITCLEALINNGASLMEIEKESGLPYAAILLLDTKHPLYAVLTNNSELTLNNPTFFRELNQVLLWIVNNPVITKETRRLISDLISTNEALVDSQEFSNKVVGIKTAQRTYEVLESCVATLDAEIKEQIQSDPDIKQLNKRLVFLGDLVSAQLTPGERLTVKQFLTEQNNNLEAFWPKINKYIPFIPFDILKEQAVEGLLKNIRILELRLELFPIQSNLLLLNKRPRNRLSKEQKQLAKQESEILTELKTLSSRSEDPVNAIKKLEAIENHFLSVMKEFSKASPQLQFLENMESMTDLLSFDFESLVDEDLSTKPEPVVENALEPNRHQFFQQVEEVEEETTKQHSFDC